MHNIDRKALITRLQEEFGYPLRGAKLVADKLMKADPQIKSAFISWWESDELSTQLEVEKYTVIRLMEERDMNPVAAFLTLDWLVREPEAALESLKHGYDRIV